MLLTKIRGYLEPKLCRKCVKELLKFLSGDVVDFGLTKGQGLNTNVLWWCRTSFIALDHDES